MSQLSIKRLLLIIFTFAMFAICVFGYWLWQEKEMHLNTALLNSDDIQYNLKKGSTLKQVLFELTDLGILSNPYYLLFEARQTNKGNLIKAGEYRIQPGTTPRQLLDQFIDGKQVQYSLTLIEGWNYREVFKALKEHEQLVQTLDDLTPEEIMNILDMQGVHPEGQFYPETYHFPKGTTDVDFLKRANLRLQTVLNEEWENRAEDLPYQTPYEALVMASIIEKETGAAEERGMIAGVFVRRLLKDMKLQTDPTVIYAMGEQFDGNIRKKDLSIDSPYNTYVYKGLPPTPIAIAGRAAIHAALHPQDGKALFFVSKGNGLHYFSETLEEHNQAVRKYQLNQ